MKDLEPITREETMLAKVAGQDVPTLEPVTREEFFLAKAGGQDVPELEPVTRKEYFLADVIEAIESGGGGGSDLGTKTISANGVYKASDDSLDGYSKVTVNVPAPTGTKAISITENGTTTEDVTQYAGAEITVNVSGGGGTGLTKLNEFSITSAVREVSVPLTASMIANYDEFICFYTFTSSDDWMYFNVDETELVDRPTQYDKKSTSHMGIRVVQRGIQYDSESPNFSFSHRSKTSHLFQSKSIGEHTLKFIMYNTASTINSGKVSLYGVNYADL